MNSYSHWLFDHNFGLALVIDDLAGNRHNFAIPINFGPASKFVREAGGIMIVNN
jgi:hypothetical protein